MIAVLSLIFATSLWGLNFHYAKLILAEVAFLEGGFWRYLLGALVLVLISSRKLPSLTQFKNHMKPILIIGGVGLFSFNVFFFLGMKTTSGVNGALIMGLNPALTLLYSHFILRTPIHKNHLIGIFIALIGVLFLLFKGEFSQILELGFSSGDILVFIGVNFFALHHVWVKKYSTPDLTTSQYTLMAALICLGGFSLILPFTEFKPVLEHSFSFWVGVVGIGALGTGVSYYFWTRGVQAIGADKAGVFMNLVPLSAGLSAVFFGEDLSSYHWISAFIIITGVLLMQINLNSLTSKKP